MSIWVDFVQMWTFFMGNAESGTSDEEDVKDTMNDSNSKEVVRVFQPQKLRQELENGKSTSTILIKSD